MNQKEEEKKGLLINVIEKFVGRVEKKKQLKVEF